ncbi:MAG: 23S rRNA (guanosine(2251)-2'-O)-methyltransferase RlmB [Alphaproteobacteria bacterium]
MQGGKQSAPRPSGPKLAPAQLYGFHAVAEAWQNEARSIKALYVTEQGLASFTEIANSTNLNRPAPQIMEKATLEKLLPRDAVHQGLAIACGNLPETDIQDFIIRAQNNPSRLVMLDQVTDPHNVGAILRSACAFGFDGMVMQRKHAPELNGVLAKTACGAAEHVPVAYETNLSRSIETLQEAGYFVYGLDERGEDIGSFQDDIPDKIVLVLGAEGPGLRRLVKEGCDTLMRLPMHGAMPSINVSNAAAVAFYALMSK